MLFDDAAVFIDRLLYQWHFECRSRGVIDWLFLFAPMLILLEVPRYFLSCWGIYIADLLGYPKRDTKAEEEFLRRAPLVSIVVAGKDEGEIIERAITSLMDQDYPNFEIIIVDDASSDDMYARAQRYARRGCCRLVKNSNERTGRPGASNHGLRVANGEFVLSVDADTTFDRDMVRNAVRHFHDPSVGVVAGNVLVSNQRTNLLTQLQTLEYAVAIELRKRWTELMGCTVQASGAIGAFRRAAVMSIGGWDAELAEDADISLRLRKQGWQIAFAPDAVAYTDVPDSIDVLLNQRTRWDRGAVRTYYRKHARLMNPKHGGFSFALELWTEFLLFVGATLIYPIYLVWMMLNAPWSLLFATLFCAGVYTVFNISIIPIISKLCNRIERPWSLLYPALMTPCFKEIMRWERFRAVVLELFWIDYSDSFLPDSAWDHARRF